MSSRRTLKVDVEEHHLKCGKAGSAHLCPLAIALSPRLGGWIEVTQDGWVEVYEIVWGLLKTNLPKMVIQYDPVLGRPLGKIRAPEFVPFQRQGKLLFDFPLPAEATQYMKRIDAGEKVEPRSFEIEIPDQGREP